MMPTVICLTPVKNEAWILDRFLSAASLWADYIIIADQMSTDGSREIALNYPKVILIDNTSTEFNELDRKRLLINEARKIKGPRLLITLDADEIFSPEIFTSGEWSEVLNQKPGTVIDFQWANLLPDFKKMWLSYFFPWGYMDDDNEDYDIGLEKNSIHCARVPMVENSLHYRVTSFKVMHFQYTNWERMLIKQKYYQCLEIIKNNKRSAVDIFRQYNHMYNLKNIQIETIPIEWLKWYNSNNIKLSISIQDKDFEWYLFEMRKFFNEYGVKMFKKIDIWQIDWRDNINFRSDNIKDPRNLIDKTIHSWLIFSQNKIEYKFVRRIDRLLKYFFSY